MNEKQKKEEKKRTGKQKLKSKTKHTYYSLRLN